MVSASTTGDAEGNMRLELLTAILLVALPAQPQRGVIAGIRLSDQTTRTGQSVGVTVTGTNPCGAVEIDQGDGTVVTHPISALPATIPYTYKQPGTYIVRARGMGNCDGQTQTRVRVTGPPLQPSPQPQAPPPSSRDDAPDWTNEWFAALDANHDGRITRAEWRFSEDSFRRADRNGDGVVTRREFLGQNETNGSAPPPSGPTIFVNATEPWTDTGIYVAAGDDLRVTASGTITLSSDGTDQASPRGAASGRRAPDGPLPQQVAGALIGRVGEGAPFYIGDGSSRIRAPESGRLFLGVNDDYLGDNGGSFRVTVTIPRQ
jgi:EF hand